MQVARVLKIIDSNTGNITLHGAARDRVSQAAAAGLIAENMRADVEAIRRENTRLRQDLAINKEVSKQSQRKLSEFRKDRLAWYAGECDKYWIQSKQSGTNGIRDVALGFCFVGIALGSAIITIAAVIIS